MGLFVQNIHVCLGGLFVPEAYITATRQYVAQANSWSLEELCLEVNVTASQSTTLDACSFGVTGLKLQGATCSNNKLSLSNAISTVLPLTQLRWGKQTSAEKKASVVSVKASLLGSAWVMVGLHLRGNNCTTALNAHGSLSPELMNSKSLCLSHR